MASSGTVGRMETDLGALTDRSSRVWRAVELGIAAVATDRREAVVGALLDTCAEGLVLAHRTTLVVAEDDLWSDLDALAAIWADVHGHLLRVRDSVVAAQPLIEEAREQDESWRALRDGIRHLEDLQVRLRARPRDHEVALAAQRAIRAVEGLGDRAFIRAVERPPATAPDDDVRLAAALAVLTAVAARTAAERTAVTRRR